MKIHPVHTSVIMLFMLYSLSCRKEPAEKAQKNETSKINSILTDNRLNAYENHTREYKALRRYDSLEIERYLKGDVDEDDLNAIDSVLLHYVEKNPVPTYDWSDSLYAYKNDLDNNLIARGIARQTRIKALIAFAETKEEKCEIVKDAYGIFFENDSGSRDEEYQILINARRIDVDVYKKLWEYGDCVDLHSRESLSDFINIIEPDNEVFVYPRDSA